MKLLRERLAPDVVRAKVYALRDRLHLDLPADLIEELLLLASEETGILKDARDGQEIHTGSTWQE
ncbi:MAG: hypothetical protein O7H41_08425 [Planctomycetota bacterium]|nr:hypothetical protein [Planctomycetota bacterium]